MAGAVRGAAYWVLFSCAPKQLSLRSLGLGLQVRADGEGPMGFAAGAIGKGAGIGLLQMFSPVFLHVAFMLVSCAPSFPSHSRPR